MFLERSSSYTQRETGIPFSARRLARAVPQPPAPITPTGSTSPPSLVRSLTHVPPQFPAEIHNDTATRKSPTPLCKRGARWEDLRVAASLVLMTPSAKH